MSPTSRNWRPPRALGIQEGGVYVPRSDVAALQLPWWGGHRGQRHTGRSRLVGAEALAMTPDAAAAETVRGWGGAVPSETCGAEPRRPRRPSESHQNPEWPALADGTGRGGRPVASRSRGQEAARSAYGPVCHVTGRWARPFSARRPTSTGSHEPIWLPRTRPSGPGIPGPDLGPGGH